MFLELVKKIKTILINTFSRKSEKNIETKYYSYNTIPLKVYFDIATTGNLELLIIDGELDNNVLEIWEEIIKQDDKAKGKNSYNKVFKLHQVYAKLQYSYLYIRACLFQLYLERDVVVIGELKKLGYIIDVDNYYYSIEQNLTKSSNFITRIISKQKEIKRLEEEHKNLPAITYDQLIAELSFQLAPTIIGDDITLARYNEYYKILKRKNAHEQSLITKQNGRRRNR